MKNTIKTIFIFIGIIAFLLTLFFEAFAAPPLKRRHPLRKRPVIKRLFAPAPLVKRPLSPPPPAWIFLGKALQAHFRGLCRGLLEASLR